MGRWMLPIIAILSISTAVACSSTVAGSAGQGSAAAAGSAAGSAPGSAHQGVSEGLPTGSGAENGSSSSGARSGSTSHSNSSKSSRSSVVSAAVALTGTVTSASWVQDSKASVLVSYQCTSSAATVLNLAWSYDGLGGNTSSPVTCTGKATQVSLDTSDQILWVHGSTIGIQDSFTSGGQTFGSSSTNFTVGEASNHANDSTNSAGGLSIFGTLFTYTIDCVGPPGTTLTMHASALYNGNTHSIPSFTDSTCNGDQRHQDYVDNQNGFPDGASIEVDWFLSSGGGGASPIFKTTVMEP